MTGNLEQRASVGPVRIISVFPLPSVARAEIARRFAMEDADPASLGTHSPQSEPDVLLLGPPLRVDEAFLARLPASIGAIATYSVGFDHIDLDAVRARGLALFDTPSGSLQCRGVIRRHERLVNHIAVIDELREAGGHRIHNEGLASSPGGEAFSFTPARTAPGWTRSAT